MTLSRSTHNKSSYMDHCSVYCWNERRKDKPRQVITSSITCHKLRHNTLLLLCFTILVALLYVCFCERMYFQGYGWMNYDSSFYCYISFCFFRWKNFVEKFSLPKNSNKNCLLEDYEIIKISLATTCLIIQIWLQWGSLKKGICWHYNVVSVRRTDFSSTTKSGLEAIQRRMTIHHSAVNSGIANNCIYGLTAAPVIPANNCGWWKQKCTPMLFVFHTTFLKDIRTSTRTVFTLKWKSME